MTSDSIINRKIKAILLGVTDYSDIPDTPDLPAGKKDTALMISALLSGLCLSPFHIWVKRENPGRITSTDFLDGIRIFLNDVGEDDIVILYFSGHGLLLPEGHALLFSDGPVLTQSVIDFFDALQVRKRILFLDCCMSGDFAVTDMDLSENADWLEKLLGEGTIVFASSRAGEKSGYSAASASLFTAFLWNAMTNRFYIRKGKISMDTIRELVFREAEAWNEAHADRTQHPVFRSSMGGTVYFPVSVFNPYHVRHFFAERKDFCVAGVRPLHSNINKRYAVKVILKHAVTKKELSVYNHAVIRMVQPLEIFASRKEELRWKGKPLKLVFTYFGFSQEDIAAGCHAYYTTWAETRTDREKWYREGRNAEVIDGILINQNPTYPLCRRLTEENTAEDREVMLQTKKLMRQIIACGEDVIRNCREYRNGTVTSEELTEEILPVLQEADRLYLQAADLPVPSVRLTKWSLLCANVAGDVQDLSLLVSNLIRKFPEPEKAEDRRSVESLIERYHEDLEILWGEEKDIVSY